MSSDSPSTSDSSGLSEKGSSTQSLRAAENKTYRFLVSIHHPAQAHFYRPIIDELEDLGHLVRVCVRDKEQASDLLTAHDIEHRVLATAGDSLAETALRQAAYESRLFREAWKFEPDVLTSVGGIEISHVAPLVGANALAFTDTPSRVGRLLTTPAVTATCTPRAFEGTVRGECRRYDGYQELAYLHPERFEPDLHGLRQAGVDPDEPYFLLRFVSWQAYHDVGSHGLSPEQKLSLVELLEEYGTVYVSSEQPLPARLEPYQPPTEPHQLHDLLAGADLYVGDSGTMATEAAILGTPAVRVSSLVADSDLGNFLELAEEYELLFLFADGERAIERVRTLLETPDIQEKWKQRRERLLADTIDVTAYAVEQLEAVAHETRQENHPLYE